MKANLFAAVLSSLVISSSVQAAFIHPQLPAPTSLQASIAKIDLNKADTKALKNSVKGIGQKRAEAIVKYRDAHGRFTSFEDLAKVPGFGKQFVKNHLNQLQQRIMIN